jgi:site-specific recombinase XerD
MTQPLSTAQRVIPEGQGVNVEDAARSFIRALRVANKSPRTLQTYGESIGQFAAYLSAHGMPATADGFQREHVEEFLLDLRDRGMKPATVSNRYRALRRFCGWLVTEGERTGDPMKNMEPPKIPEYAPRVLTLDELKRLVEVTGKDKSLAGRRDLALIYLFADTGARRSEIANLRLSYRDTDENGKPVGPVRSDLDLDQPAGALVKLWGKGSRERIVRIGDKAASALDRYIRLRARSSGAQSPWLWLNAKGGRLTDSGIFQAIRKRGEAADVEALYLHTFRHSAAHHWLMGGGGEVDLQTRAGWQSPQMLRRYASSTRAERSHAAHERHGLGDRL